MTTLIIATRNAHKVAEIQAILGKQFRYLSLNDFVGAPTPLENAASFAGNATIKAVELAGWLAAQPKVLLAKAGGSVDAVHVLADDSGLIVDALNGAPGVHSARFAGMDTGMPGNSPDHANNAKLIRLLKDVPATNRCARFCCAIALDRILMSSITGKVLAPVSGGAARQVLTFEGFCEGRIALSASGQGGFGYDPLFIPEGQSKSFAELGEKEKNRISHRSRALEKVRAKLS